MAVNPFSAGNYMLKANKSNTRTRCEICSMLTIKTPEPSQWRRASVFIVDFEHISHLILVYLLLTLSRQMPAENELIATGFFFYPLKTLGFLMFPGDMKRDQWVAWNVLNKYLIQALYNHVTYVKFYSAISINTNSVFQYKPKNKEVNQQKLFFYLPSSRIFQ